MKRVTRNVTAVSTKSWERAKGVLVRTKYWTDGALAQTMLSLCLPRWGPLGETLLEQDHPSDENPNRKYGSFRV